MIKIFISLLIVFSTFASFAHSLPSQKFFKTGVRLDSHLFNNATCEEKKTYYINNQVQTNFLTAHLMCKNFGFEQVNFNNLKEMDGFLEYMQRKFGEC